MKRQRGNSGGDAFIKARYEVHGDNQNFAGLF
jgi:hypothetical protein